MNTVWFSGNMRSSPKQNELCAHFEYPLRIDIEPVKCPEIRDRPWCEMESNCLYIGYKCVYKGYSHEYTDTILNVFTDTKLRDGAEYVYGIYDWIEENKLNSQRTIYGSHISGSIEFNRELIIGPYSRVFILVMVGEQYDWQIPRPEQELLLTFRSLNGQIVEKSIIREDVEPEYVKCTKYFRVVPIDHIQPGTYSSLELTSTGPGYVVASIYVSPVNRPFDPDWVADLAYKLS
jgi:hypothetical protein